MVLIGVIVFLLATIFGFISLARTWGGCSDNWAICTIICGVLTFAGCFAGLWLPAIGFGIIFLLGGYIPLSASGNDSSKKNYSDNNSRRIARVLDDKNRKELEAKEQEEKMLSIQRFISSINNRIAVLEGKKDSLKCEILKLRDKQQKILNQYVTTSDYGEQSNSSIESKNSKNDEVYGVEIHCDFCDKIYSIKERRCPNCKAENPYWENISDFE